jgi:integrase
MDFLSRFVKEKYGRSLKSLEFTDITEQFMKDYVFYIESEGAKKQNGGGVRNKLHSLYRVVQIAEKRHIPGADISVFACTNQKFKGVETIPATISLKLMRAMESIDRSLLSDEENYHLDLFLFSYYCGGMGPLDAAYLTWRCIDVNKRMIVYERIKTTKKAKPPFVPRAEKIIAKYRSECYGDFVLPIFNKKHDTHARKKMRIGNLSGHVNDTLRRIVSLLGSDEEITWYSARGTFITMMIDKGYRPEIVAEYSGNSVQVIYKFYYKNTRQDDIIAELCREFAA